MKSALAFLTLIVTTASAQIRLGPEIPIAEVRVGAAGTNARVTSVVPSRGGYVAFWTTSREYTRYPPYGSAFARRFTRDAVPDGEPLKLDLIDKPLTISAARAPGSGFLVAWHSDDLDILFAPFDERLTTTRDPIKLSITGTEPAVACNASRCLIAWHEQSGTVEAVVVASDGTLLTSPFQIAGNSVQFALAGVKSSFLVIAAPRSLDGVAATIVGSLGTIDSVTRLGTSVFGWPVAAASDDTGYVVAWQESDEIALATLDGTGRIRARRGMPKETTLFALSLAASRSTYLLLATSWIPGTTPLPDGPLPARVQEVELSRAFEPLSAPRDLKTFGFHGSGAAAASGGDGYLISWFQRGYANSFVAAVRQQNVVPSQPNNDGVPVALAPVAQQPLAVASAESTHLVIWVESEVTRSVVLARRFQRDGTPLDDQPIVLVDAQPFYGVSAASDGRDYLVCWQRGVARIDGTTGILQRTATFDADRTSPLLWTGSGYVAGANRTRSNVVVLLRFSADGSFAGEIPITDEASAFAVAASRGRTLVAWGVSHPLRSQMKFMVIDDAGRTLSQSTVPLPRAPDVIRAASTANIFIIADQSYANGLFVMPITLDGIALGRARVDEKASLWPGAAAAVNDRFIFTSYLNPNELNFVNVSNGRVENKLSLGSTSVAFETQPHGNALSLVMPDAERGRAVLRELSIAADPRRRAVH